MFSVRKSTHIQSLTAPSCKYKDQFLLLLEHHIN